MEKERSPHHGFTLIELMVVVAVIGILAAIAIPSFMRFTYRARSAEIPAILSGIRQLEVAYFGTNSYFVSAPPSPLLCTGGNPPASSSRCDWTPVFDGDGSDGNDNSGFSRMGYIPEGPLWAQYAVVTGCPPPPGRGDRCFTAEARADLDGDGNPQLWAVARPDEAGQFAAGLNFGGSSPPVDEAGAPVAGEVAKDFTGSMF